jgi:murein DD-endopeptidase MepM/ murein hydrolase activator NlpD
VQKLQNKSIFHGMKEPRTIIIARGDTIRYFTLTPWMAILAGTFILGLVTSYLLATFYLVFRDDLIQGSIARQARLQQAYEDRIASLRTQFDHLTSRQMLDQKLMEEKIRQLAVRQKTLNEQNLRLEPVLQRASKNMPAKLRALPDIAETEEADESYGIDFIITGPVPSDRKKPSPLNKPVKLNIEKANLLFDRMDSSLARLEMRQAGQIQNLSNMAYKSADRIKAALANTGIRLQPAQKQSDMGGPLIPENTDLGKNFDSGIAYLDAAFLQLERAKALANSVPIANPVPGKPVSSPFGARRDPLLGLLAFHSGMDFRTASGSSVLATGKGIVTAADYRGGYGNMVDIDHGNGFSTRYGHMSQILVTAGQPVSIGQVIGKTGSTGRSTGPHLHYEIRRSGSAVNPAGYLNIGRQIAAEL